MATKSTPASRHFSTSFRTSFGSTGPVIEHPSAIEIAALTSGLCALASRSSHIRLTLAMADSRLRLALAWLCSSVAETTVAISATPEASASLTPRSFSASATPCAPGNDAMVAMMSRTSTNCGNVLAGRNEPTSKCRTPAPYSSRIQRCFADVEGNVFTSCRPSRRPVSRRLTRLRDKRLECGSCEPHSGFGGWSHNVTVLWTKPPGPSRFGDRLCRLLPNRPCMSTSREGFSGRRT